jgi:phosphatidylglycerophosphate synthase
MGNASSRTGSLTSATAAAGAGTRGAPAYLFVGGALLVLALATAPIAGLWGPPAGLAVSLYAVIALLVLAGLRHHGLRRFGAANGITLLRAAAVAFLAGITALDAPLSAALRGTVVGIGCAGLLLDGVDGFVARRGGLASRFGARFDMEIDAISVLVFTLLLLRAGQAGSWVLAIGLARYIFVGVGWLWPPLARELPQSLRRKTICVVTVTALLVALMPFVAAGPARIICAAALVVLVYSFAVDCVWSVRIWRLSKTERA